ncbi:MAG: hypothetical protein NT007_02755 [Candidatus Kapabacteria bacterium]|nr:hypothetical protein [Candidatus Kapabacteria bacterium]
MKNRFIRAKSGDLWNMRFEDFEYNVNGQLETYKLKNAFSDASSDEPCLDETAQTTWKYRYSAAGEREQKRQYSNSSSPQNAYPWEYYLLGAENKQLAIYHGISSYCSGPGSDVFIYPSEYLSYGAQGFSDIISRPDGTKEYSIFDHLGSVRERFSQSGELIASYDYEPYGEVIGKVEKPRLTYIDKEKDKESKLHDFGARKYENGIGRFVQPEPLWEKFYSLSPYVYSANNPISARDNTGYLIEWLGTPEEQEYSKQMYNRSENYLRDNGAKEAADNLKQLREDQSFTIKFQIDAEQEVDYMGDNQFSAKKNQITWSPTLGFLTDNGALAPAEVLAHEVDHALNFNLFYTYYMFLNTWIDKNTNQKHEEIRVMENEDKTSTELNHKKDKNKKIRENHDKGTPKQVEGPDCVPE